MNAKYPPDLSHILTSARRLASGDRSLSLGEHLAAALVLNRPAVLAELNYTIAEALHRIGADWAALIPDAERIIQNEITIEREAEQRAVDAAATAALLPTPEVDLQTTLVTYGSAPGYRDASITFDMQPIGTDKTTRATIRIRPEDAESIVHHLRDVHRFAWSRPHPPLDAKEGEKRPRWID